MNKNPKKRLTYPQLLQHPWIKGLTKPETIAEESEAEEDAAADSLADAAAKQLNLNAEGADPEVAAWVTGALERKKRGLVPKVDGGRPALHAAPLDTVSPAASPMVDG